MLLYRRKMTQNLPNSICDIKCNPHHRENDFQHLVLNEYFPKHRRQVVSSLDKKENNRHQIQAQYECLMWLSMVE